MNKKDSEKALRPSQRKSITEYSAHFGESYRYENKMRTRRVIRIVFMVLCLLALVCAGFFFTDVLIRFTEIPPEEVTQEALRIWSSFPSTLL